MSTRIAEWRFSVWKWWSGSKWEGPQGVTETPAPLRPDLDGARAVALLAALHISDPEDIIVNEGSDGPERVLVYLSGSMKQRRAWVEDFHEALLDHGPQLVDVFETIAPVQEVGVCPTCGSNDPAVRVGPKVPQTVSSILTYVCTDEFHG